MDHDHHDYMEHEAGTREMLNRIDAGAKHLLTITRRRISGALDQLDAGDFRDANEALAMAQQSLSPLANAQTYIAIAGDAELIECRELRQGMLIVDIGVIDSIDVEHCEVERCDGHVKVKIGAHEMSFGGSQPIYVKQLDDLE